MFSNLQNISAKEFEEIFNQIIDGKIEENSVKDFLISLNDAKLPENSFIGAISALKKRMKIIEAPENAIDVCGTGGDKLNTLNISTAVCFVVAGAGVSVAKHGNKAMSSNSGSADIFNELGIQTLNKKEEIEKCLKNNNLCFLFAPLFHESLKGLAKIRKEIGVPTIFNFLGPLLNPANTKKQLIGVSKRKMMPKMMNALAQDKNKTIYMAHGFDGMDEITLCDNSYLLKLENGKISEEEVINPEKYGFKKIKIDEIAGKDPKYNAQKLISLLEGEKSAYRDIVILNSAFALKLSGKINNIEDGIDLSKEVIDSGKSNNILKKFGKLS